MSRKYFGTDGIRGTIGKFPMTPDFALKLGWAAGKVLSNNSNPLAVIGKDTRISGYMLESALQAGLVAAGLDILLVGPMPTPAVSYLTRTFRASAGIVISASHNPYYDNGIKFFSANGTKLDDAIEMKIEAYLEKDIVTVSSDYLGKAVRVEDAAGRYIEFCKRSVPAEMSLNGLRLVVDCANGATYHVTPSVLEELGAEVIPIYNEPNGVNINKECGATSLSNLQKNVKTYRANVGIALDGDGDRLMMVDEQGDVVDGDEIIAILAKHRLEHESLSGDVVGTLMSNLGLEKAIQNMHVGFRRANVGDRYVMEQLRACNGVLGGEGSGHIIIRDRIETGDGTIAALQVLHAMVVSGKTLHELKQVMEKYPQILINVPIQKKINLDKAKGIQASVKNVEEKLGNKGRVLLRASGTEPLIRVMVEGEDLMVITELAEQIAEAVRKAS
ncbi:MAG TPA: phosphoglucosamine mutase [Thiothrix sp.]|nr:phosphoglucosamine mutase [Thiothrix sp.]